MAWCLNCRYFLGCCIQDMYCSMDPQPSLDPRMLPWGTNVPHAMFSLVYTIYSRWCDHILRSSCYLVYYDYRFIHMNIFVSFPHIFFFFFFFSQNPPL